MEKIYIESNEFKPLLHIYDYDGSELTIIPNRLVEEYPGNNNTENQKDLRFWV